MASAKYVLSGSLGSSIVLVTIGQDNNKKQLFLHPDLLCKRSAFFRKCLNGDWKETHTRTVDFPEDDPASFELWATSAYSGHVRQTAEEEENPQHWVTLGKVFALAEKLQDMQGKNIVTEAIYKPDSLSIEKGNRDCGYGIDHLRWHARSFPNPKAPC